MKKIIGYFSSGKTWQLTKIKDYKKIFNHDLTIHYLQHEILESIEREMTHISKGDAVGFYAGIRFLFPEVNHLAHLYFGHKGKDWRKLETRLVSQYMKKFKILYPESSIYYLVFRHGLMHSHHPKWLRRKDKRIGWYISNKAKLNEFGIFIPEFTEQVKSAILQFIYELESEKKNNKNYRLKKILEAMIESRKVLSKKELKLYSRKKSSA